MRVRRLFLLAPVMMLAACSTGSDGSAAVPPNDDATVAPRPPESFAIEEEVAFVPGDLADGTLTVDGSPVDYVTITPEGFEPGDTAPVLLAFPPGGQSIDTTRSVAQQTYATQAVERGWIVVSPASPIGGDRWYEESRLLVPSMMDWIETWVTPEGGTMHIAGVSNGGLSTFATAALVPDRVQSITTFPGFPRDDAARDALPQLADVPVRMFVGETDTGWVEPMQETADALDELGGDVTLEIVPGEGHIIGELRDGIRIFDELDAIRDR